MAPAVASAIFFGLLLLPHLCSSYQTSHNPWSRRFVRLRSSNDETRPSTPTETCSSIPSGADQILIIDQDASCLITFDEMFTSFIVLTLLNFCRPGKRQQVAFDPPLEPMLAPQRRWETKAAAAAFVHRRLRSRCPETQDDTCGGTVRRG